MARLSLTEDVLKSILASDGWGRSGVEVTLNEEAATEQVTESTEEQETEAETHSCPLCESQLSEAISDERLSNHVDTILEALEEVESVNEEKAVSLQEAFDNASDEEVAALVEDILASLEDDEDEE